MSCGILEDKSIGNCSNSGISSKYKTVVLVSDNPELQVFEPSDTSPAVVLKKRIVCGEEYIYAIPCDGKDDKRVGWMMGGSYIYTSDSRFRNISKYPVPLHDRQETYSQYERLSK